MLRRFFNGFKITDSRTVFIKFLAGEYNKKIFIFCRRRQIISSPDQGKPIWTRKNKRKDDQKEMRDKMKDKVRVGKGVTEKIDNSNKFYLNSIYINGTLQHENAGYMLQSPNREYAYRQIKDGDKSTLDVVYDIKGETSERTCFRAVDSGEDQYLKSHTYYGGDLHREIYLSFADVAETLILSRKDRNNPEYESYSKHLVAVLFQYSQKNFGLSIRELHLNTYLLIVTVRLISDDGVSQETTFLGVEVPMEKIGCTGTIRKETENFFKQAGLYDLWDQVEILDFQVAGITLDVSGKKFKEKLAEYLFVDPLHMGECEYAAKYNGGMIFCGRYFYYEDNLKKAAIQKDAEVITNIDQRGKMKDGRKIETRNPKVMGLLRFLYLMRITESASEFGMIVDDILDGKCPYCEELDENDGKVIKGVSDYLNKNWETEQKEYIRYFSKSPRCYGNSESEQGRKDREAFLFNQAKGRAGVQELLDRLESKGWCFPDVDFYRWMREKAGL